MAAPDTPIIRFLNHLRNALESGEFVEIVLTQPAEAESAVVRIAARVVDLKNKPHLSFTLREAKRDTTENLPLEQGVQRIEFLLRTEFRSAMLRTTARDWQITFPAKGKARLVAHKATVTTAPARSHDREKSTALGASANDWLQGLGILNEAGHPLPSMTDKLRQITHYTEILTHLAADCGWRQDSDETKTPLFIADMGCGKGHLTFAAWHLFERVLRWPARVHGVEVRADLVNQANALAHQISAQNLEFQTGQIATADLPNLDALIALHACNTATDDAILRGIRSGARLIVVAPCCHQALRPELGNPEILAGLLRHGLMKERLAEWLTDGLRTLSLEWAGYRTKVIEFVASEHTPKNLMIAAVKQHAPFSDASARKRIIELKQFFGIQHHALDPLIEK